jgi:hypothetical protein
LIPQSVIASQRKKGEAYSIPDSLGQARVSRPGESMAHAIVSGECIYQIRSATLEVADIEDQYRLRCRLLSHAARGQGKATAL